ncbi:outer membrane protein assembly factor BamD [Parabacteroides sp. OttesenSCG-928-O15]|nr:outer membrane protein assembly factor BamD [Parabacteroides sp. OttesenSCG-928-O15]
MRKLLIPLCLILASHGAIGQRTYQFESPNRLFIEGKELFELKNYAGAIDKLQAFKQQPIDTDSRQEADYMIASAFFQQGRGEADLVLKDFLDTYPDTRHADEINFMIGSVHFGKEEYQKALFWLRESNIDMLSAEQQEAYSFRLAYSLLQTGDRGTAKGYFNRIRHPSPPASRPLWA